MYALNGYIDGNAIVTDENISTYNGYNVIITILDNTRSRQTTSTKADEKMKSAARNIAGLWSSYHDGRSVEDVVRSMRRGRDFDF